MMTFTIIVLLGFFGALTETLIEQGVKRLIARMSPVNLVRGVLLPNPSDERWKASEPCRDPDCSYCSRYLKLGPIVVHQNGRVFIDGVKQRGIGWSRYARATFHSQAERRALLAVQGD